MIRNAAALLRRSTASATASLSRGTPPLQRSPASSARGFHAAVKSGQRRADTVLPSLRRGYITGMDENSRSIEEKKKKLQRVLSDEVVAAGAHKRVEEQLAGHDRGSLLLDRLRLKGDIEVFSVMRKEITEDLLATIRRQGASGNVDQETLMLLRAAQASQDIQELKQSVSDIKDSVTRHDQDIKTHRYVSQFFLAVLAVATGYVYTSNK